MGGQLWRGAGCPSHGVGMCGMCRASMHAVLECSYQCVAPRAVGVPLLACRLMHHLAPLLRCHHVHVQTHQVGVSSLVVDCPAV